MPFDGAAGPESTKLENHPLFESVLHGNNCRLGAATFQRRSHNNKLVHVEYTEAEARSRKHTRPVGPACASTYVSIGATCNDSCPFKNNGCYVQYGQAANTMRRLDKAAAALELSGTQANILEAELIGAMWPKGVPQDGPGGTGRPCRQHVGGDTASPAGARALGQAAGDYMKRGGGPTWSYTHRWREIAREDFGPISIYASVETAEQAHAAISRGFTPAVTLRHHLSEKAYRAPFLPGLKMVPCPAQTRGLKCVECRLCWRDLPKGTAVGFAVHGQGEGRAKRSLPVVEATAA